MAKDHGAQCLQHRDRDVEDTYRSMNFTRFRVLASYFLSCIRMLLMRLLGPEPVILVTAVASPFSKSAL